MGQNNFNSLMEKVINCKDSFTCYEDIIEFYNFNTRDLKLGEIDDEVAISIDAMIRFYNTIDDERNVPIESRKPIKIYIDSPGGDLIATFTIIDAIKLSKTPVWTICTGMAYSGGFFCFITGHKRFAYPLSSFMFHEGATGNSCDAGKFRNYSDFYFKQLDVLEQLTLDNTKITKEEYEKIRKDDYWLLAEEAIKKGVCDEIIHEFR